ncbi:hypothetical protein [Burkholderia ubonensis]|uniref:hypothetical protein n=1 Tax=Burkholderia ubonensis TaxID=101571 RepID=UPI000753C620|nr:hypothetical protein [Burkholderia ubonensis]KWC23221.1 hypothetical protein WL49_05455 [Burkholderia ubonensis]KWC29640.1 hypothetical protein WL48_24785 [Burkholderia ubonensis]OJA82544.1 hypothetical protein BGV48_28395 [Burkholderia ubonensis]
MAIDHPIPYQQLTERTEADMRAYLACATTVAESSMHIALQASARSLFVLWLGFANRLHATLDAAERPAVEADHARLLALLANAAAPVEPITPAGARVPAEMGAELEAAGLRYASLSPADFVGNTLKVEVATLGRLGLIGPDTAAQVPAGCLIRVLRDEGDALRARVMWPWQLQQDGR